MGRRRLPRLGRRGAHPAAKGVGGRQAGLTLIELLVAMSLGAAVVLVHGETIVEPVQPGTNRAAIEAGADVLAHPGLISQTDARLAAQRGVMLEVTAKNGHCLTNGHVVAMARETGAGLVFGTDSHMPGDLVTQQQCRRIAI